MRVLSAETDPSSVSLPLLVHSRCTASASFSKYGGRRPPTTFSHKGRREVVPFSADRPRTRGLEYALIRAAGAFWGTPAGLGERAMSLGTILVIILIIFLLGGFSGRFGGYGYGRGQSVMGLGGVILIVLLILLLLGKL
jgi:hypothetical protein